MRSGNPWDLRSCCQGSDETLQEYIRRFSRKRTELSSVTNADVIRAFLAGTSYRTLVHELGCMGPRTTEELLDIATNFASGEEAVGAIFDRSKGKVKWEDEAVEGPSNPQRKTTKRNKPRHEDSLVAAAERRSGRPPTEGTPGHFDKLLEGPCPNHEFPVKHAYKDCNLMKRFFVEGSTTGDQRRKPEN